MPPVGGVEKINSVVNFNSDLKVPFSQVVFSDSQAAGAALADFAEVEFGIENVGPWQTHVSLITGDVVNGVPNHFLIDVTFEKGVTPREFVTSLRENGVFLTASSHSGIPDGGHTFLKRFRDYEMVVTYPRLEVPSSEKPTPGLR